MTAPSVASGGEPSARSPLGAIARWSAPAVASSPVQVARVELLVLSAALGALGGGLEALVLVIVGEPWQAWAALLGALCWALLPVVLRVTGSLERALDGLAVALSALKALHGLAAHDLSALVWLGVLPLVMLQLSAPRRAVAWLAAVVALWVGVEAALALEGALQVTPLPWLLAARGLGTLGAVFGVSLASARARAETEASLETVRDEARRASALKSEFLASFSHEIRTPLNGVLGTAEVLLWGPLPPETRAQVLVIQRSGSSLLRTIDDLLEISRIEAGRVELFPVHVELPRLLGEVVELFRARARTRGLGLSLHLEPDHPRGVLVDDLRLQQVVQNLVSNAVKYTERGEVRLRLAGAPTEAGQVRVRITVEDTGPGISPDAARKLFSAFSQARPRTDRAKGSGLGLALCKQFVELMGGTLTFQTELQRGTTFCVELTLAAADEPVPRPPPQPLAPPLEAPARPLKVLVVDDNEVNLKVASSLVARLGHAVEVARDGRQALAAIASASPDVVLMDCHMPVLDGLEATRQLRASGDLRPVIAVTASVYAEDQARCQEAGMDRFLSKPLSLGALQSALADLPRVPQSWPSQAPTTPRALVVEDDPLMRVASVRMLRAEGYSVRDAGNVEAALLDFQRGNPDYLLVDLVLGDGEDGLRLAARMRERRASLKVVVTSGMHLSQSQHAWLEEIGGRFLPKPYTQEDLVEALRRCTGHARLPGSPPAEP